MIIQILLSILWLVIVPFCSGLLLTKLLKKEAQTIGMIFLNGYLISIAFFQCLYLIAVITDMEFRRLVLIYQIVMAVYSLGSVIFGYKVLKNLPKIKITSLSIAAIAVILFQLIMTWRLRIADGDDAFYIATAVSTVQSGTMNRILPYTGAVSGELDIRHALASMPIWLAFLSKATTIHAAVLAHGILAPIFLCLFYFLSAQIGRALLGEKKEYIPLFVLFASIINIFGNTSLYTSQTFLITRTWQGKALLANICIPFAFLILIWIVQTVKEEKVSWVIYVLAALLMVMSSAMTSAGILFLPAVLGMGAILLTVCKRKISIALWMTLACVPVGLVGVLFIVL